MKFISASHLIAIVTTAAVVYVDRQTGGNASLIEAVILYGLLVISGKLNVSKRLED